MERLGTALGLLAIAGLTAWAAGGAVMDPPGKRGNPWRIGTPSAARYGKARRVVSVNVGTDEILLSLLPPERIAAVSALSDDPTISSATALAKAVPRRVTMEAERILALEPDLLIVPPYTRREVLAQLEAGGMQILRIPDFHTLADIRVQLRFLGEALGEPARAEALVAGMDAVLGDVRRRTAGLPRPRVLYVGLNGDTMGQGTNFDLFVEAAGGTNVAAEAGIVGREQIHLEKALALDPDILLVSSYRRGTSGAQKAGDMGVRPELAEDPAWRASRAVREGRVRVLNGAHLLSTSHHVTRLAEDLARILHPECYAP